MPLIYLADNIYYQGSKEDFNTLSLYASFHAGLAGGLQLELRENPPIFFPIIHTPELIYQFLYDFAIAFEGLVPIIEARQ